MKYEEAIDNLNTIEVIFDAPDLAEALDIAIEALQKQVPMKPRTYDSVPHARCGNCGNAVKIFIDGHEYHHCLYCGQRIDWSDTE